MFLTNYRPIALLPSISKIFDFILLQQLTSHLMENKLLSLRQYGFRAKHSTELTDLNLVDYLTYKLDNGIIPINIYIDLSKDFDALIHSILLDKLSHYGINGVAKNLLQSYLLNRRSTSDTLENKTGVPQGSVLGPFLFQCTSMTCRHVQIYSI